MQAKLAHGGDEVTAEAELKRTLRETIRYDRNTVWRDMVALERGHTAPRVARPGAAKVGGAASRRRSAVTIVVSLIVFVVLLNVDLVPGRAQQRCLAMVALLSLLWCTEAVPLYVTSMLVPALTVTLDILPSHDDPSTPMPAPDAAKRVFQVQSSGCVPACIR
jgi:phosphate transporter